MKFRGATMQWEDIQRFARTLDVEFNSKEESNDERKEKEKKIIRIEMRDEDNGNKQNRNKNSNNYQGNYEKRDNKNVYENSSNKYYQYQNNRGRGYYRGSFRGNRGNYGRGTSYYGNYNSTNVKLCSACYRIGHVEENCRMKKGQCLTCGDNNHNRFECPRNVHLFGNQRTEKASETKEEQRHSTNRNTRSEN